MSRKILLAISLALVVISVGAIGCTGDFGFPGSPEALPESPEALPAGGNIILSQQNTGMWVVGEGTVSVVPDVAIVNLGVEAQAETVTEAQGQAAEAMVAVMGVLDDYGIANKDIQTQRFSIQPVKRWDNGKEILLGYRVTNIVAIKIRELDDTGAIIDAVAEAGGDYTRINSISFTVDDPTDYYEEAREKAMEDAEAKAQQLADLAGVDLGKPTYVNESGGFIPVPREYYMAVPGAVPAPAPSPPISPGETEIRLTVQVVYSIIE